MQAIAVIFDTWGGKRNKDLFHCLKEWYENQSKRSKQGLYNGRMTNFMSAIETLDVYSDMEVARKVVKAVTDVYIENWNSGALDDFGEELKSVKLEIESIRDEASLSEMDVKLINKLIINDKRTVAISLIIIARPTLLVSFLKLSL